MVRLHETTGRALCRLGFVMGCLVPTALVLAYALVIRTPVYRAWHEAYWSGRLGVTVRLGQVWHPRPGMTRYVGCRAFEPETAAEVARIDKVERLSTTAGREVRAGRAVLKVDGLQDVLDRAAQAMRRSAAETERLSLVAQEVVCQQQGTSQRLLGLRLDCLRAAAKTAIAGQFRPDDALPDEAVRFEVQRVRVPSPAVWRVQWESRAAVPVALVHAWWPEGARLGAGARLTGRLDAVQRASGWEVRFAGQVVSLELDRLVSDQFPHRLSGSAEWTIQEAHFAAGRVLRARGAVRAGPGTISHSLIEAGTQWLGWLAFAEEPPAEDSLLKYDRLAAAFMLDHDELVLRGLCREQGDGVLLAGYRAPLLLEPRRAVPAAALVRTLAPPDESVAWTHAGSRALAGWLPPPAHQAVRMAQVPQRIRTPDPRPMESESSPGGPGDVGGRRTGSAESGTSTNDRSARVPNRRTPRSSPDSRGTSDGSRFGAPLR